ncbi:MAG TPA: HAMP domain-containing sensor histidine kinase [Cyclobacteriaceae bacterium]|nr:HAMP domain-containing sensor histidine kinase [Cyclobacteriaceae bacterium]
MKLLHYTSLWFLAALFLILLIWAGSFYFIMLDEIYDSIDDGLENQKSLIIQKASEDPSILGRLDFDESNYQIRKIPAALAVNYRDAYRDTLMYMQVEEDFEPVRLLSTAFEYKGEYYELSVITSMVEEDDLIEDLLYSLLVLFLGIIASMVILNNLLLKKIWQPFYQLLERLRNFRLDDPKLFHAPNSQIEEFRLLDNSLQKLLERNVQTFNEQKQFIENASHELQTPLAISLNKLELMVNHPMEEEQLVLAASVMDNLERLIRLNKSLLLLSRITNQQYGAEEEIDVNSVVKKALHDFSDQADHKIIHLILEEKGHIKAKMNPDLAHMLVVNLLKNAIVHNHPGGEVQVLIEDQAFTVSNTGKMEALDEKRIFERFYKQGSNGSSTGLGLAIVKAITDLYGFKVAYSFNGRHEVRVEVRRQV